MSKPMYTKLIRRRRRRAAGRGGRAVQPHGQGRRGGGGGPWAGGEGHERRRRARRRRRASWHRPGRPRPRPRPGGRLGRAGGVAASWSCSCRACPAFGGGGGVQRVPWPFSPWTTLPVPWWGGKKKDGGGHIFLPRFARPACRGRVVPRPAPSVARRGRAAAVAAPRILPAPLATPLYV